MPGQELKDLAAQVKDVSVTVGMDSRCHIDLSGIVEEVKVQYDAIAARSLEEAEAYSRRQVRGSRSGADQGGRRPPAQEAPPQGRRKSPSALSAESL